MSTAAVQVAELLAAPRGYDQPRVRQVLDRAEADLGLDQTVDDVVLPTLRLVGTLWAGGTLDIAHEHALSVSLRGWVQLAPLT